MSRKRSRSTTPPPAEKSLMSISKLIPLDTHQVYGSSSIKDRGSTFIAVFSPAAPPKQLQARGDFTTATHRIAAWRKPSSQRSLSGSQRLHDTGHDDDGEQYAGKRLEKVLLEMNVEGAVVVARWYGGLLLGPVRFTHIENCARGAIDRWKRDVASAKENDHPAQKRKVQDKDAELSEMVGILQQRDQSIAVLRELLRKKHDKLSGQEGEAVAQSPQTPHKAPDYAAMPFQVMRRLEKARDATISWILEEIDKAEKEELDSDKVREMDEHHKSPDPP